MYAGALLATLGRGRARYAFDAVATTDGRARALGALSELLVRGTRVYAGRWVLDPTSRHDDGLFELFAFRSARQWIARAARDVGGAALGLAHAPSEPPVRFARLDLALRPLDGAAPPPGQCDGEVLPRCARARVDVTPRAVRLVVPKATPADP